MSSSRIKKEKILKVSLLSLLIILLICSISVVYILESIGCYEYVDELCYECNDIGGLSSYIDYSMLSGDMKKRISREELDFSSDDSIYNVAECFSEQTDNKEFLAYTCTTSSFPHSHLYKKMSINGKAYLVSYTIVFSPKAFSPKPKIVDWEASIIDIEV
ncbi:MAG: hypothetical protein IKW87_00150 [Ruminococcus sp.]|nr:hypothetical protein [Ruminococcus sp.]